MRVVSCIVFAFTLAAGAAPTLGAEKPETSHLAFVTEYIRELAAIENIRASAEQELKQGTKDEVSSNAIHFSTLIQIELRSQIHMLKGMHLNPPFDQLIPNLTDFYEHKIALHLTSELLTWVVGNLSAFCFKTGGCDHITHLKPGARE